MPATSRSITGCTREEGGGRNLGEACHIYDLFTYLTGAHVARRPGRSDPADDGALRPNRQLRRHAAVRRRLGGHAHLHGTRVPRRIPKEQMEVFVDGKVIVLDDYRKPDRQRLDRAAG